MDRALGRLLAGWLLWLAGGGVTWLVLFSEFGLGLRLPLLQSVLIGLGALTLPLLLAAVVRQPAEADRRPAGRALQWLPRLYLAVVVGGAGVAAFWLARDWLAFLRTMSGALLGGGVALVVVLLALAETLRRYAA